MNLTIFTIAKNVSIGLFATVQRLNASCIPNLQPATKTTFRLFVTCESMSVMYSFAVNSPRRHIGHS